MSDRGLHPIVWLGLGAAGVWGASHYLAPMLAHPRKKEGRTKLGKDGNPRSESAQPPASAPSSSAPSSSAPSSSAPPSSVLPSRAPSSLLASSTAAPATRKPSAAAAPSHEFDPIFGAFAFGRRLPIPYLRALAWSESRLKAEIDGGLFQIAPVTRDDFAKRHKLDASTLDLRNPMTNTAIAADTLAAIKESLTKNHARQVNAIEDWTNPRFVELLSLAWNAGWSEARGVGRVLAFLDERGQFNATVGDIAKHAREAGAVAWLYAYPKRIDYARAVAARFVAENARDAREKVSAFYQGAIKSKGAA